MNQYLYLDDATLLNTIAQQLDRLAADPAGIHALAAELRLAAADRKDNAVRSIIQDAREFAADVKDAAKNAVEDAKDAVVGKIDSLIHPSKDEPAAAPAADTPATPTPQG